MLHGGTSAVPDEYYYMTCHREENTNDDKNLTEILKAKAESENKNYADFLKSQYSIKTDKGTYKNITGFYLTVDELANKLFSFNIEFADAEGN